MAEWRRRQGDQAMLVDGTEISASADDLNKIAGLAAILGATTVAADVLPIPVTHRVVTKTTGGDAEALSLADGLPGQKLTVVLGTDGGGDGTLTPTTATGFVAVVLADAGDHVTFEFIDATVGWVIIGTGGVAAPPAITV